MFYGLDQSYLEGIMWVPRVKTANLSGLDRCQFLPYLHYHSFWGLHVIEEEIQNFHSGTFKIKNIFYKYIVFC